MRRMKSGSSISGKIESFGHVIHVEVSLLQNPSIQNHFQDDVYIIHFPLFLFIHINKKSEPNKHKTTLKTCTIIKRTDLLLFIKQEDVFKSGFSERHCAWNFFSTVGCVYHPNSLSPICTTGIHVKIMQIEQLSWREVKRQSQSEVGVLEKDQNRILPHILTLRLCAFELALNTFVII